MPVKFRRRPARVVTHTGFNPETHRTSSDDQAPIFTWFHQVGYHADVPALRRDFPEVGWQSATEWARNQDWSIFELRA